jgi:hypothetical protein
MLRRAKATELVAGPRVDWKPPPITCEPDGQVAETPAVDPDPLATVAAVEESVTALVAFRQ